MEESSFVAYGSLSGSRFAAFRTSSTLPTLACPKADPRVKAEVERIGCSFLHLLDGVAQPGCVGNRCHESVEKCLFHTLHYLFDALPSLLGYLFRGFPEISKLPVSRVGPVPLWMKPTGAWAFKFEINTAW